MGSSRSICHKKNESLRLCVNCRDLNRLTIGNGYPLLSIDELLDSLCEAKYFSKIDLMMGYHQIRLESSPIPKTEFKTKYVFFEFTVLPFGFTNTPGFFHVNYERDARQLHR